MIEDALNSLIAQRQTDQAQGPEADRLRSLLRSEALEQLQARTREQSRALAQAVDPAFVREAGVQFLIGLRQQIADLDAQIAQAGDPQVQRLQIELERKGQQLRSLAADALPFDFAAFAQDQRRALDDQVEELEALLRLSGDPGILQARRRLSQLNLAQESAALAGQLADFAGLSQQRQQNERLRLLLSTQAAREAARSARALSVERRANERARGFLQNIELEARVRSFNLAPEQTLRRYGRFLGDLLSNLEAAEELSTFAERAPSGNSNGNHKAVWPYCSDSNKASFQSINWRRPIMTPRLRP